MLLARLAQRHGIYYGWVIVAGLAVVGAMLPSMAGINMGLFIKPMQDDLDFGQSLFGLAQTARLIGFSATGWLIGRYLDSHGARGGLIVAGLISGGLVALLSLIDAGWQFLAIFFLSGLAGLQAMGSNLFTTVPIANWFVRKRGRALSMLFLGTPAGIFISPPITQALINGLGWRSAFLVLGAVSAAIIVLIAVFVIRRRPQDLGLEPDGDDAGAGTAQGRRRHAAEYSWTREEAMRSSAFWRLASVDGLRMGAMGTLGLFRIPYFIDQGVEPQIVAFALSFEALVGGSFSVPAGWLADRFQARYVAAFSTLMMILTFALSAGADTPIEVFLSTACFGIGAGSFQVSQGVIWPSYFGGANIGKIRGIALPLGLSLSAISAPLTGLVRDETGSFTIAWIVAAIALAIATVILLITPRPQPPAHVAVRVATEA